MNREENNVMLSVIVPIFNEEDSLWMMADRLAPYLDKSVGPGKWQYVLVDNGSTDNSAQVIENIIRKWPQCTKCYLERPDYGNALYFGLKKANGTWAYIINVDFWDPVFLQWSWTHRESYDLILGSKRADPSINVQPKYRRVLSWGLNTLLQLFFGFVGTDTHGQKLLHLPAMRPFLEQCVMRRGQFDTEFTLRAMRNGLWLAEVPVPIVEERPQRNLMLKKITQNLLDILKLRQVIQQVPYTHTIRYHRWARQDMDHGVSTQEILSRQRRFTEQVQQNTHKEIPGKRVVDSLKNASSKGGFTKKKAFYEDKYSTGEEIQRTSKLYTLRCIPETGSLNVLDIGCGSGLNSQRIKELGHSVYGIDLSEEAIRKYTQRGFEGCVMDIEHGLGFANEEFDLVFCSEVIEHIVNPEDVMREISRILRSGGKLVLSTPNSAFWIYRVAGLFGITVSEMQHPKHVRFFSKRSLQQLAGKSGFQSIKIMGRNIYLILPDSKRTLLRRLIALIGFHKEFRFKSQSFFWHFSNHSRFFNSFFADTLIMVAQKV